MCLNAYQRLPESSWQWLTVLRGWQYFISDRSSGEADMQDVYILRGCECMRLALRGADIKVADIILGG